MQDVVIGGVGIHAFGRFDLTTRDLGEAAAAAALADAGIELGDVDLVLVANVFDDMALGHAIVERLGRTGVPIVDVEAACASSASALFLGGRLIEGGGVGCVLCIGVEKAPRGVVPGAGFDQWQIDSGMGLSPLYFALQARDLLDTTAVTVEDLADVSVKNHANAISNPNAMYRRAVSREEVLASTPVCSPLSLLMLCSPNEGAAAAVLMRGDVAARHGVEVPIHLRAVQVVSRTQDDWFVPAPAFSTSTMTSLTRRAAALAYEESGIGPSEISVIECQDTDAASELIAYRDLGLCEHGDEADLLRSGATSMGGRQPVNPSGGLLSKGEPLGASGLGQVHELVLQLRGQAGSRQIEDAAVGLAHVMGAGHNASVAVLSR